MSIIRLSMLSLSLLMVVSIMAARTGKGRVIPIDQIFAVTNNGEHNGAGLSRSRVDSGNDGNPSSRRFTKDGQAMIREFDILTPVLIVEQVPADDAGGSGNGGKGGSRGRGRQNRNSGQRNSRRSRRNATPHSSKYWPNNVVPYEFDSSISSETRAAFVTAVAEYTKYTCVKWELRSGQTDYVNVEDAGAGSGCYSYIGRVGGNQTLNINQPGCAANQVIVHEMMHAIGVFHEHTRPDRNSYVTINTGNIQANMLDNFDITTNGEVFGTAYDYRSVMHYGKNAFSNGGITIVTADSSFANIIGTAPTLSFGDIALINKMYGCADSCTARSCPDNSFQDQSCSCKCETTTGDYENPVVTCAEVCSAVSVPCNCGFWSNSCLNLPQTTCDSAGTKACECNANHVLHNGVCTLTSSITCGALDVDCKCSLNSGSCQQFDSNAVCESSTNKCVCGSGFIAQNGQCVAANSIACDAAEKVCGCSSKGVSACVSVPNSSCDGGTDSCTCNINYFRSNAGACEQAPSCTSIDLPCHCEVQDTSACSALPNTQCDVDTSACVCPPLYIKQGGQCFLVYSSDGSTVAPFTHSSGSQYNVDWTPTASPDNSAFGVASNNFYLFATGNSGDIAAMETGNVSMAAGESYCVRLALDLNKAAVYIRPKSQTNGVTYGHNLIRYGGYLGYFYSLQVTIPSVPIPITMKFAIEATSYSSTIPSAGESWSVRMDPIIVQSGACPN